MANLRQNLEIISSKPELLDGLEDAERAAELKASTLEEEVKQLHEELKSIKDLLMSNEEEK